MPEEIKKVTPEAIQPPEPMVTYAGKVVTEGSRNVVEPEIVTPAEPPELLGVRIEREVVGINTGRSAHEAE